MDEVPGVRVIFVQIRETTCMSKPVNEVNF